MPSISVLVPLTQRRVERRSHVTSQCASAMRSNSTELERTYCFDTAYSIYNRIEGKGRSEGVWPAGRRKPLVSWWSGRRGQGHEEGG